MATLVLQVAGGTLGTMISGPFGGMLGRAAGGLAGAAIDGSLLGGGSGNRVVEGPRLKEIEGLASSEGAPIPRVYGRARLGGQLIWSTRFEEEVQLSITRTRAGGKGASRATKTYETRYSYFANLAVAICEGEIAFVRRIWADGREIDQAGLTIRVHRGSRDQQADPLIVAKEGGATPAYRDTAYVVFERFPLADYGNRVPQFSFEVVRRVAGLGDMVRSVALIPGAGEFVYATMPVSHEPQPGVTESLTRHQLFAASDADAAIHHLRALCPNLRRVALVASWFGDDLRAGTCTVAPRVELSHKPTTGAQWLVAGLDRPAARAVSQFNGKPAFGGTPSDADLIALIRRLRDVHGLEVVLYPFLMMDVAPGNALPDPAGADVQPAYPWRGRITSHPGPGRPSSVDGTAMASAQIAAFLGTLGPGDFSIEGGAVACARPDEWSYRRLIMHYAQIAAAAGGVHGFVIGSELVGLTRVRGAAGGYPMVDGLVTLATDVRSMLPAAKLTYAADWTEYGAHVRSGGAEVDFPLDPLWASSAIDAVGIDFYPPLSDWRDGSGHADAALAHGPYDVDFLRARVAAGEAFDWYYLDVASRLVQQRSAIADGAYGKPWIYRPKDLLGWWNSAHVARRGGVETTPTAWQPGSKPIWLTEIGIPAIDKGTNAPHVFPDPKSADGGAPWFSSGARDDLAQARGLEAMLSAFDPALPGFTLERNPIHATTGIRMVDPVATTVWAWDARPFPAFPAFSGFWADAANWETGHWLTGRIEGAPVDRLVRAILADYGLPLPHELRIDGFLDGYVLDRTLSAREAIEPLARAFGFDATMNGAGLAFRGRDGEVARALTLDDLVAEPDGEPWQLRRAEESELPLELRLSFCDSEGDYARSAVRSRRLAGGARREAGIDTAIVTRRAEAQRLVDRRLQELWAGRELAEFALSPRLLGLEAGDVVSLPMALGKRLFRIVRIADGPVRRVTARAVEPAIYRDVGNRATPGPLRLPPAQPGRPLAVPMVLPLAIERPPSLLSVAAFAKPWPGALGIWRAPEGGAFEPFGLLDVSAIAGETLTPLLPGPLWRTDRRGVFEASLRGGEVSSVAPSAALGGANAFALIGADGTIEVFTAAKIELIGIERYRLSHLVRGLGMSEAAASRTLPAGARIVMLDGSAVTLAIEPGEIGRPWRFRIGPAQRDPADPSMAEFTATAGALPLQPLSPVRPRARRMADGIAIDWIRRGRVGADSWELAEVPLGEMDERYELSILSEGGILRSIVVDSPAWLYPGALEQVDFGTDQTELSLSIAQRVAEVGPGEQWRGRVRVR